MEEYVRKSRTIKSFKIVRGRQQLDKLCFFRNLAYHREGNPDVQREARRLFTTWAIHKGIPDDTDSFEGVTLDDIPQLENLFKVNIRVYALQHETNLTAVEIEDIMETEEQDEPEHRFSAICLHRPRGIYGTTMNLNMNNSHFSYIKRLGTYCKSWRCENCMVFFGRRSSYLRHVSEKRCAEIQHIYPGYGYSPPLTIFQQLEQNGIHVREEDRYYPYHLNYDFEARFEEVPSADGRTQITKKLIPASFSIMSNVPGYDRPHFVKDGDPKAQVASFDNYIHEVADASHTIMKDNFRTVVHALKEKVDEIKAHEMELEALKAMETDENDQQRLDELEVLVYQGKRWHALSLRFDKWLKQLPVIGFNSGRFDLNLVKEYFIPHLLERNPRGKGITPIKKGNTFMAIMMEDVLMLDISNYLAAGTSYDKWIKAFQIPQTKGIWPYEWFQDTQQLNQDHLPPKDAFYSTLRQKGISDDEYEYAKEVWRANDFQNMGDMLRWYNDLDVVPFSQALTKMFGHFKSMKIDMFKQGAISLPGLAMLHMFSDQDPSDFFELFSESTKDWHTTVRKNIVGGPSIIFSRFHAVNITKIRSGFLDVESIQGLDANALYLYCLGLLMPVGQFVEYHPISENHVEIPVEEGALSVEEVQRSIEANRKIKFKRTKQKGGDELNYVLWEFEQLQKKYPQKKLTLMHSHNGGQKSFLKNTTPILVDGYVPEIDTVIQYHGCYFHGHGCMQGHMNEEHRRDGDHRTREIRKFLIDDGHTLIEKYECEFKEECTSNPNLARFIEKRHLWGWNYISADQIVNAVTQDKLFGLVEVDIQVGRVHCVFCTARHYECIKY